MPAILQFVPSDPNYRFSTALGDATYIFDVRWNESDSAWYFDMLEVDETPIVTGAKIVLGTYFGRRSTHPFFISNILTAVDTGADNLDPGYDDLGTRVEIWHYTTDELMGAAFEAGL